MKRALSGICISTLVLVCTSAAMPPQPTAEGMLGGIKAERYYLGRPGNIDLPSENTRLAAVASPRAIVLLIDFDDYLPWSEERNAAFFQHMLFGGDEGSLRDYFLEVSNDSFDLDGVVRGWFRSNALYSDIVNTGPECGERNDFGLDNSDQAINPYKSDFPLNVWGIVAEAVYLADAAVDFSQFDNDGPDGIPDSGDDDGYVDFLFVIHPGVGAEHMIGSCDDIWSLKSDLESYPPTQDTVADGVGVGPFVIVPEWGEIGVFAHECCHLLGLPDLYNTEDPYQGTVVGWHCLMDYGAWGGPQHSAGSNPSHLSAPMKYFLGWIDPVHVCLGCESGDSVIAAEVYPVENQRYESAYMILNNPGGMDWNPDGSGDGEYFMVENRQRDVGYFDEYIPGSGLLIWKVDESRRHNNDPECRLAEVIRAGGLIHHVGSVYDYWPGPYEKTELTPDTEPSSSLSGGRFSGVAIENITELSRWRISMDIRLGLPERGIAYAFPNPFRPAGGAKLRIVFVRQPGPSKPWGFSVDIFDIEGNFIRRLDGDGETLDNGTALWDARDENGREVDDGLYMYVVESTGERASGVIAVSR